MPRIGRSVMPHDRFGARGRIGKDPDVDHAPYIFQELGFIDRVATPDMQKRGIIGYRGRGTVTLRSLNEFNTKKYEDKIKQLETKRKKAPSTIGQVFKEGQEALKKYKEKSAKAKKLGDIIAFPRADEAVGAYVNSKSELIGSFENQINQVQERIKTAEQRLQRTRDYRTRDRVDRIYRNYDIRVERDFISSLRKEIGVLSEFRDKNLKEMTFENPASYQFEQIRDYAREVQRADERASSVRNRNYLNSRLHRHRQQEAQEKAQQELDAILKKHPDAQVAHDGTLYVLDPVREQSIILLPPGSVKTE